MIKVNDLDEEFTFRMVQHTLSVAVTTKLLAYLRSKEIEYTEQNISDLDAGFLMGNTPDWRD